MNNINKRENYLDTTLIRDKALMNNKESNEIIDEGEEMDINEPSDELFEKISLNNDSLNEDFVKLNIYLFNFNVGFKKKI